MSVRKVELQDTGIDWGALPWRQGAAVLVWIVATACTKQVTALLLPPYLDWLAALLLQGVLTLLESPIWRRYAWDELQREYYRRPLSMVNIGALLVDNLLNLGGVWLVLRTAHQWQPVIGLAEMFGRGQPEPLQGVWAFILCFVIGLLLCATPEKLYYD